MRSARRTGSRGRASRTRTRPRARGTRSRRTRRSRARTRRHRGDGRGSPEAAFQQDRAGHDRGASRDVAGRSRRLARRRRRARSEAPALPCTRRSTPASARARARGSPCARRSHPQRKRESGHRPDHDRDGQREPREVRVREDVERRSEVDLPDEVARSPRPSGRRSRPDVSSDSWREDVERQQLVGGVRLPRWPSGARGRRTAGSPPRRRSRRSAAPAARAGNRMPPESSEPAGSGVPVPGAYAGSRTSMSKERKSGPSPARARARAPYASGESATSSSHGITSKPSSSGIAASSGP